MTSLPHVSSTAATGLSRRSFVAFLAGTAALGLAGCGTSSGSEASGSESATNPYDLQQAGVLRAGTLTDAPPNVYLKDGKFTGYDNELLLAVAAKLGLRVEFVGTEFSSLLAQVKTRKFDLGSSSISITEFLLCQAAASRRGAAASWSVWRWP